MKRELISIIIPTYNGENKIVNALNSINRQTFQRYEVIVVNDGSKDQTEKVVLEYVRENPKIKYFYKENSGVSDSRNYGIDKSEGDYITFLDCDDYYNNEWLSIMYKKIKKENADVCYCGYNNFIKENIKKVETKFKKRNVLTSYLLGKLKLQTACFLIRKELIEKNQLRFRTQANWGEDYEFFCKVLKYSKKNTYLKEYLTYYNIEDTSDKLSAFNVNQIEKNIEMVENIKKDIPLTKKEEKALINYLAPAMIINFLYYNKNRINKDTTKQIIDNNIKYIKEMKFVNGLRSIKIYILFQKIKREVLK